MLNHNIKQQIKKWALEKPLEEICGLLIKSNNDLFPFLCKNISSEPDKHFHLNIYDYLRASKEGTILGVFHSHDYDTASQLDIQNSKAHNLYSVIYCKNDDKFIELFGNEYNYVEKYLGRKFDVYKFDCYELTKEYYKNELGINLPEFGRDKNWYQNMPKLIEDNWARYFTEVKDKQKNDILLFQIRHDYISHMAIYLGGNLMLHVELNRESKIDVLSDKWLKRLNKVVRYKKNKK